MTAMTQSAPLLAAPRRVLDVVRHRSGRDVLLEAGNGDLVDHSVSSRAHDVVVRAVLSKDLFPLRDGSTQQRTLGVVPGGAVIAHRLASELVAVVVPVCRTAGRAWLWLLGPDERVDVAAVQQLAAEVAAHSADPWASEDVDAMVDGRAPLPFGWVASGTTVIVVRTAAPHAVVTALREVARAHDVPAVVGVSRGEVVALSPTRDQRWLQVAERSLTQLDVPCRGASCCAPAGESPTVPQLHARARAAAAVSDGPLRQAGALASRVAVAQAVEALASSPVHSDPTAELLRHDAARGADLASTLLTWLELHGEVGETAKRLTVHPNTLRYRLRRAAELVDGDLNDPDVRLDVHLRLRRALLRTGADVGSA